MNDVVVSFIRTVVPVIVGSAGSFLATKGFKLDDQSTVALATLLTSLFTAVYYALVRFLETKYPKFGYLLGVPRSPQY